VVLQLVSMFQYRFYSAAQFWWLDYAVSMGLSLLNVALNVVALCWLGLWFGYRARSTPAALAWTLGIAKLLPFVISAIAYPIVTRGLNRLLGGSSPRSFSWLIHLVFTVLFLYLVCFARRRLRRALGDRKDFGVQDLVLAGRELWWKARRWRPG
jgi:hypothetical protein